MNRYEVRWTDDTDKSVQGCELVTAPNSSWARESISVTRGLPRSVRMCATCLELETEAA